VKRNVITAMTDDGKKDYDVNQDTKFIGPRGGVSEKGIEDDRLEGRLAMYTTALATCSISNVGSTAVLPLVAIGH